MMDFEITRTKLVIAAMLIFYAFGCWLHILVIFDPKHQPEFAKLQDRQGPVVAWVAAITSIALWPILELWLAIKHRSR
jgi:hypothetical protein